MSEPIVEDPPLDVEPPVSPAAITKAAKPKKEKKVRKEQEGDEEKDALRIQPPTIAVSEAHASRAMRYFLASQLSAAGFDGASGEDVMWELEQCVLQCVCHSPVPCSTDVQVGSSRDSNVHTSEGLL